MFPLKIESLNTVYFNGLKKIHLLTSSIKCVFNVSISLYPPIALVCSDATIETKPEFTYKIVASQLIPPSLYTKIYLNCKIIKCNLHKYIYHDCFYLRII